MLKIGLTGGLGSGKSVVSSIFRQLGIPVFDADTEAKKLLLRQDIKNRLRELLGDSIFTGSEIDKKKMADLIFSNDTALAQVNGLIHPALGKEFDIWAQGNSASPYVVKEAAILLESKQYFNIDRIVTVFSPLELRIQRAMQRDNTSREKIMARISRQMSDEEKCKLADHIIKNDEESMLLPQVLELDKKFRKK